MRVKPLSEYHVKTKEELGVTLKGMSPCGFHYVTRVQWRDIKRNKGQVMNTSTDFAVFI